MSHRRVTLLARLEELARRLSRKCSDQGAQIVVASRVDLAVRVRATVRPMFPPLPRRCRRRSAMIRLPMLSVDAGSRARSAVAEQH
jgi:hypothetical protein